MTTWTPDQLKAHFGHDEFKGKDIVEFLQLPTYHSSGGIIRSLSHQKLITQTAHGYQFTNGTTPPPVAVTATAELTTPGCLIKVNKYYIAPATILIADTLQDGKVVLHTSILEIDGETKHPKNKRLIFTQQHAPDEYAAVLAWLRANAGMPHVDPNDAQAALQLAEEATSQLAEARKEIATLKTKIAQFRALLGE